MQASSDHDLLDQFAQNESEEAFGELVRRHIGLVYSVALRHSGNPHHAEEITQAVFIILARKARSLPRRTMLSGWLYHTARLTAANFRRSEFRRARREQEAFMQSTPEETTPDSVWLELAPLLDEAMARLGTTDRDAMVLRYFENKTLSEVGAALGIEERTAQKRVSRALDKLRRFFTKRGVSSTTAIIAGAVSAHSIQAAPVALTKSVTAVAVAKGAAASISTLTLIKGALKIMAWTKAKMAIVASVGILLAAGTTTVTVKEIQAHKTYPWQVRYANSDVLRRVPPQVGIVPAKYPSTTGGGSTAISDDAGNMKFLGISDSLEDIVSTAYGQSSERTIFLDNVSSGKFDYIANLHSGNEKALRNEIEKKFRLIGKREMRDTDVLLLYIHNLNATGLKSADPRRLKPNEGTSTSNWRAGYFSSRNRTLSSLTGFLESRLRTPVINQTGLTNQYDIDLDWEETDYQHPHLESLKQALSDQLGLDLVPTNMPIEILVVKKAK
jgi:uncharacterized protein (TIGR03435 family)